VSGQSIDVLHPQKPKRIAIVASNPSVSKQTGWAIGFWWAELTHPYLEFINAGYTVDICSPDGGKLEADDWSDPHDDGKLMAGDLISLGFMSSPKHLALIEHSKSINQIAVEDYDAVLFIGGQGPMYTFHNNDRVHQIFADFYTAGKVSAVLCHGTCLLLEAQVDGKPLVTGKTWTVFANSEESYADEFVGQQMQPFRIEDEARKIPDTNFIVSGRFKSHAVRDGNLITGQQQYSALAVARLVIQALGV
jgi:putative intracellular protease/amidase